MNRNKFNIPVIIDLYTGKSNYIFHMDNTFRSRWIDGQRFGIKLRKHEKQ